MIGCCSNLPIAYLFCLMPALDARFDGFLFNFSSVLIINLAILIFPLWIMLFRKRSFTFQINLSLIMIATLLIAICLCGTVLKAELATFIGLLACLHQATAIGMVSQAIAARSLIFYDVGCIPHLYSSLPISLVVGALLGIVFDLVQIKAWITITAVTGIALGLLTYGFLLHRRLSRTDHFVNCESRTKTYTHKFKIPRVDFQGYNIYNAFVSLILEVTLASIAFPAILIEIGPTQLTKTFWAHIVILAGNLAMAYGNHARPRWWLTQIMECFLWLAFLVNILACGVFMIDGGSWSGRLWWLIFPLSLFVLGRAGYAIRSHISRVVERTDDHNMLLFLNAAVYVGYALGSAIALILAAVRVGAKGYRK